MVWFTRLRRWQTDASNGIGIRADYHDSEDDNFALGINESLNAAGLNSPTANIPFGGFKITGAGSGTGASDYATVSQVQGRTVAYAVDASGSDAYVLTLSPAISGYVAGQQFLFMVGTTNTGAATLNINGNGSRNIKKWTGTTLADGDLVAGQLAFVAYDGSDFQLLSAPSGAVDQNGSTIYAADGGANDAYAITLSPAPAAYVTGFVCRFKANTKSTGAATLNVNSLGAKTIKGTFGATLGNQDIAANQIVEVIYDGTDFQMLSPPFGVIGQNGSTVFAVDASGSDSYAITLSPAPTDLNTGMSLRFKAGTANTGAATLNVNALGAKTIKKFGSTNDLATGDILANQLVEVIYDGTNFQMLSCVDDIINLTTDGSPDATADYVKTWDASASTYKKVLLGNIATAATQADQETGTSTTSFVTPGRQQFHASAAKAFVSFTLTGSIERGYNVTSVTDTSSSVKAINFTTAFSDAFYVGFFTQVQSSSSSYTANMTITNRTTTVCTMFNVDETTNVTGWNAVFLGDQ